VSAIDAYGNNIGQSIQAYNISVNSGDGKIHNGGSSNSSITFDNFSTSAFVYQAPIGIKDTKNVIINITPNDTEKRL
jgi:hypothetical protein